MKNILKQYLILSIPFIMAVTLTGCSLTNNKTDSSDEPGITIESNDATNKNNEAIDKKIFDDLNPYSSDYSFKDMEPNDSTKILQVYLDGNTDWNKSIVQKLKKAIQDKKLNNVAVEVYDINDETTRSNNNVALSQYDTNKDNDISRTYAMVIDLKEQTQLSYTNIATDKDLNDLISSINDTKTSQ